MAKQPIKIDPPEAAPPPESANVDNGALRLPTPPAERPTPRPGIMLGDTEKALLLLGLCCGQVMGMIGPERAATLAARLDQPAARRVAMLDAAGLHLSRRTVR